MKIKLIRRFIGRKWRPKLAADPGRSSPELSRGNQLSGIWELRHAKIAAGADIGFADRIRGAGQKGTGAGQSDSFGRGKATRKVLVPIEQSASECASCKWDRRRKRAEARCRRPTSIPPLALRSQSPEYRCPPVHEAGSDRIAANQGESGRSTGQTALGSGPKPEAGKTAEPSRTGPTPLRGCGTWNTGADQCRGPKTSALALSGAAKREAATKRKPRVPSRNA
jgi:hypothetical protein